MREIKFRAWDKELKFFVDAYRYFLEFDGSAWFNLGTESGEDNLIEQSFKLVVEQFTGLLDKNGKEIYEGDIVSHNRYISAPCDYHTGEPAYTEGDCARVGHITITTSKGVVMNGTLVFTPDDETGVEKRKYRGNPGCWDSFAEVIGNIHENPEILSK